MKIKIEEAKKEDINSIVKLYIGLDDYHREIDSKYYKSGKEREDNLRKRLIRTLSKKRRNQKILLAKVGKKVVGFFNAGIHKSYPYCREEKIGELYAVYIEKNFGEKE